MSRLYIISFKRLLDSVESDPLSLNELGSKKYSDYRRYNARYCIVGRSAGDDADGGYTVICDTMNYNSYPNNFTKEVVKFFQTVFFPGTIKPIYNVEHADDLKVTFSNMIRMIPALHKLFLEHPDAGTRRSALEAFNDMYIVYQDKPNSGGIDIPTFLTEFHPESIAWDKGFAFADISALPEAAADDTPPVTSLPKISAEGCDDIERKIIERINAGHKQMILTGAPGTGKTFRVKRLIQKLTEGHSERRGFIQFHSSYDYSEFIEGLRPALTGNGEVQFVRIDGIFKEFCRRAAADVDNWYFFHIDEINRADLSRVFGEIMYCLEYRGSRDESGNYIPDPIGTQYRSLREHFIDEDGIAHPMDDPVFRDGFYIPDNVVVIGTMNEIDRSVETFDFALRRRFKWINIKASDTMNVLYEGTAGGADDPDKAVSELISHINSLNGYIASDPFLGEDHQLGQSYFHDYDTANTSDEYRNEYFENELSAILKEYVRGRSDAHKFIEGCKQAFGVTEQ